MSKVSKKELEGNIGYLLSLCSAGQVAYEDGYIKFFDAGRCVCQLQIYSSYRFALYLLKYIGLSI